MLTFDRGDCRFSCRVAGVLIHDGQVLLQTAPTMNFWVLPGGRLEMGEESDVALVREIREELAIEVEIDRLLWIVENFFEYEGIRCHEIGMYYLLSHADPHALRGADPIRGWEPLDNGNLELIFEWHYIADLPDSPLYPSFLRTRLASLPSVPERIVHRGGKD